MPKLAEHGANQHAAGHGNAKSVDEGTTATYTLRRLKRDNPERSPRAWGRPLLEIRVTELLERRRQFVAVQLADEGAAVLRDPLDPHHATGVRGDIVV